MKPIIDKIYVIAWFILFPLPFFYSSRAARKVLIFFIVLIVLSGCFQHYFKTNTQTSVDASTIQRVMSTNKYTIIHYKNGVKGLMNLSVLNDSLEADIIPIAPEHSRYLNPRDGTNRVKRWDKETALMEVHLYSPIDITAQQNHLSIPLSSFNRIDIYELDKGATTSNHVISWIGVTAASAFAISLIVLAIACNCPQVYVNNNGDYQFVSGVYSGAVYSSLERSDYLPLQNFTPTANSCGIKIKNVNDEEQFINRIQLMQVTHPANTNILVDRHGKVLSYNKLQLPILAVVNKQTDVAKQLSSVDDDQYSFDSEKSENGFSNVSLTFDKPAEAQKAKLVIHGGNSLWSGYLYHTFAQLFGNGYEKWRNLKDKSEPGEMERWQKEQALPLMVYIERDGKWEFTDYFAHTGNTASRDMIMELDVSDIKTAQVKIKLETVYQFWNLDFAGIDFSENIQPTVNLLNPVKALKPDGSDQSAMLSAVDKNYSYLNSKEEINLEYRLSDVKKEINSYFLVSTGYYHNIKKYKGAPQTEALLRFKSRNAFDDFSRKKFAEIQNSFSLHDAQK